MDRLSIVVADAAVYIDKVGYSDLDFSECGIPEDVWALQWENNAGWVEFRTNVDNQRITELPAWANACIAKFWEFDEFLKQPPPPPTPEELMEYNKSYAMHLLQICDWVMLPDVNLVNKEEWVTYRAGLRALVNNPPAVENYVFPTPPEEVWA